MRLTDILTPRRVKVPLEATTKRGAIEELIDLLVANGDVAERDGALQAVLERESTRTTGIGRGVAIPHGKCAAAGGLVMAVGKPAAPIDFESVDEQPVTLVILLLSPVGQTGPHIQALARISRLTSLDAFRRGLAAAQTPEELFQAVKTFEESEE